MTLVLVAADPGRWAFTADGPAAADLPASHRRWTTDSPGDVPSFVRHVQPLLTKAGCSNRACHGSFQGQGGFRLSLFASDPQLDYDQLVKSGRVDPEHPDDSVALQKPTLVVDHDGGLRFNKDSWQYRLLRAWVAAEAPFAVSDEPAIVSLDVTPASLTLSQTATRVALRVVARSADGTAEDVTGLTQFSSRDDAVVRVNPLGEVEAVKPGHTDLIVIYGSEVKSVAAVVPYAESTANPATLPLRNSIDRFVQERLSALRVPASGTASDAEFLRRVCLDITGTLPTPDEVRTFLADASTDKRDRKIDELLERPTYSTWWATQLSDITGLNAPLILGNTDFGPLVGDLWYRWLERRVRDNTPYDQIVAGIVLGTSRRPDETYSDYSARMSSYVLTKDPRDFTDEIQMPIFWFRENLKTPEEKALAVAYTFLGVRLECAQCHKHPFDRWTQRDFQQFAALFGRVSKGVSAESQPEFDSIKGQFDSETLRTAATRRQTYWKWAREGRRVPWPEVFVSAPWEPLPAVAKDLPQQGKLLGGPTVDLAVTADPRVPLMNWLRSRDNEFFAAAFVNRVWAHYFGRGLVNPTDDFNRGNPPSHPELLRFLADAFVDSGFDMKWLHRHLVRSATYQRTWRPEPANRTDERNFSHALIRRLPAEVVVDALQQATAASDQLDKLAHSVATRRIGIQATADLRRTEYGLAVFGKPLRTVNCDCERESEPSLLQAVYLRNDPDLNRMLDRADGWLAHLSAEAGSELLVEEAFLRTVCRLPDEAELARCRQFLAESATRAEGLRDLLWSLLNTQEFVTNH
ncbi:MAG: DUF1549 domain-containing protein [Pirellulaceae bacterium]